MRYQSYVAKGAPDWLREVLEDDKQGNRGWFGSVELEVWMESLLFPREFDDKYFGKVTEKKNKKGEGEFFEAEKEEKKVFPQGKKDDQKAVDGALIKAIESVPELKTYLGARFSLKQGMKPHELVF
ncbi:60S ribosomal protein L6-3-like [Raphanus sativus]|nr:60S ribosomal protein L6-3-like [Raphanus sativus]